MTAAPWKIIALCCAVVSPALSTAPAFAQAAQEGVAVHNDWTVFVTGDRECYIASAPTGSTAKRDGQTVQAERGDIRFFVRFNPGEGVSNEVSFRAGYPLQASKAVQVTVGTSDFSFSPVVGDANEWAWPQKEDDSRIVGAMRRGSTATVTGVSARGTTTVDTFSLAGFTAAVNEAESRCK